MDKFKKIVLLFGIIIFTLPAVICLAEQDAQSANILDPDTVFKGIWRTNSGSLYEYREGKMICVSVHSIKYEGWLNKAALKNFRKKGNRWFADQATRDHDSGELRKWLVADIEINDKSFTKTIKKEFNKTLERGCKPQLWEKVK